MTTMTAPSANSILMGGGGAKSAKLTEGITITGRILQVSEPYQERDYTQSDPGNGAPKFFKNGNPIMTFYVDVATDQHDDDEDDGTRRIYMDGARIKKAVRAGVAASGASGLQVGGTLTITCTHYDTPGDIRSGKNYSVTYTPGNAASSVLMGQPDPEAQHAMRDQRDSPVQHHQQPAPTAATWPQAPAPAPEPTPIPAPAATGPAQPDAASVAAIKAAGMDPKAVWPHYTGA